MIAEMIFGCTNAGRVYGAIAQLRKSFAVGFSADT